MADAMTKILEIVKNNFPNGIRDDFIDLNKVLRIYSASGAGANISRDFIAEVIRANGIAEGGRFYFISDADSEELRRLIDSILSSHAVAYYSAVCEKHRDFLARLHIFSPEVLKKFLREVDAAHFYFDEFCSAKRASRLEYEISRAFIAAETSLSLADLQEKLPYIPAEKIAAVLADAKKYLPANTGGYIPAFRLQFDLEEIRAAKRQISAQIDANGYAENFSLSSNCALNPELNEKYLFSAIYEKFFANDFVKRGKKFYRKGDTASADATKNLREFIARHDEISLDKLFETSEKLNIAQNIALYIAHETLTRVDKNLFVKDALIHFDAAGIDAALAPFVQGKIISLQSVTSFTGFPPVEGYSWNLFLLESFLRKFSQKYVYAAPSANSANIGAIYPRTMKFKDYLDVQAAAVVQEKIPLEKSAVEEFLLAKGYRGKRIEKVTARIIARAQDFI